VSNIHPVIKTSLFFSYGISINYSDKELMEYLLSPAGEVVQTQAEDGKPFLFQVHGVQFQTNGTVIIETIMSKVG